MLLHAAICPHAGKLITVWLSGPTVVCACFTYEFLTSWAVDEIDKLFYMPYNSAKHAPLKELFYCHLQASKFLLLGFIFYNPL